MKRSTRFHDPITLSNKGPLVTLESGCMPVLHLCCRLAPDWAFVDLLSVVQPRPSTFTVHAQTIWNPRVFPQSSVRQRKGGLTTPPTTGTGAWDVIDTDLSGDGQLQSQVESCLVVCRWQAVGPEKVFTRLEHEATSACPITSSLHICILCPIFSWIMYHFLTLPQYR